MNVILRVCASLQARYIIPYQQAHFDKTKYGKRLTAYKGKYAGKRCFLIGNGPSLRAEDLTKLHESGEVTFAFNRIYNIFDKTPWRPTFYISQDEKMLAGCADIVSKLQGAEKFIPIQLKWWNDIAINNAIYCMPQHIVRHCLLITNIKFCHICKIIGMPWMLYS